MRFDMGFKFIASILLCTAGAITVAGNSSAEGSRNEATAEVTEFTEESKNAVPARFVYIQFSGEESKMIQFQHVGSIISQRISQHVMPGSRASN
jgi:hypothetical protein